MRLGCSGLLGLIALILALYVQSAFQAMLFVFSLTGSALVLPLLATLYWRQASCWGITAGIVGGAGTCLGMYAVGNMGIGGDPVYTGMLVSASCIIVGSLVENFVRKQVLGTAQTG